jgi:bifunctional DNA-binding transcriptional regulator/antitoxin component of YhaV-PrlF toxin-antitoxin module
MVSSGVDADQFRAPVQGSEGSSATFVLVPAHIMKGFGGRIRVPVAITINGVTHRTTICNMGLGPMIGIPAALRRAAGIDQGNRITISIRADREERQVAVPPDFARAMRAAMRQRFDRLAYTHRKEYVEWIEQARKPETRARRIQQAVERLR